GAPDAGDHRRHPHGVRQDAMKEEPTVVDPTMDALSWLRKRLADGCPDLVRALLERFAGELVSAEADALCGAAYGERSPERVNKRNFYRSRRWDTCAGSIDLEIPKLRAGSGRAHVALQERLLGLALERRSGSSRPRKHARIRKIPTGTAAQAIST